MPQLSTITQKGQVTIPAFIRQNWGLRPRQKVVFIEKKDAIEIKPAVDFFQLKGSIKIKKKYSDESANRAIGKYLAKKHAQENQNN